MPLDKPTLHAQLATLAQNAETLDVSLREKTALLQQMTIDLERTRGARHYHDLLVQQVQRALVQAEQEEKDAAARTAGATT